MVEDNSFYLYFFLLHFLQIGCKNMNYEITLQYIVTKDNVGYHPFWLPQAITFNYDDWWLYD